MKSIIEITLKSLPILLIASLGYFLFISPDSEISEGMKLSASALLGAISSYIFIAYSDYLNKVEKRKASHRNALANLEFKLNEQMNWLSDVIYHLSNHSKLIQSVLDGHATLVHDASQYREPIEIEPEIRDLANVSYKNELLSLLTSYRKIKNDIQSHQRGYEFMLNIVLSDKSILPSYKEGLPFHLDRTNLLKRFVEFSLNETEKALSTCRVLSKDTVSITAKLFRYLTEHPDPKDFESLIKAEKTLLAKEISDSKLRSQREIDEIEKT